MSDGRVLGDGCVADDRVVDVDGEVNVRPADPAVQAGEDALNAVRHYAQLPAYEISRIVVSAARPIIEEPLQGREEIVVRINEGLQQRIARLEAALRGLINAPTGSTKEEHAAWCKAMDFAEQALAGEEA